MSNPRLAGRYAQSLIDLAEEQQQTDTVYADICYLRQLCAGNPDFTQMLKSPVITSDKKEKILEAITAGKISALTSAFLHLLLRKTREQHLPDMANAFIRLYNQRKGIGVAQLTTAVPVSDALRQQILDRIAASTSFQKIELETKVNEELIGGFTLQLDDQFIDASVLRDLNDVKKQFLNNEYIHSIR